MNHWTELKRLAEEATPGPWEITEDSADGRDEMYCYWHRIGPIEIPGIDANKDGKYIAAANPKTILALIAENERLSEECEGCPMDYAERLREERDSQQRVCIKVMEESDQLRAEVEALRRQVETLTEWYANGLNAIQSLRTLLSAAISLDHHHAITDRTYPLRQDIDAALGRDQA